MDKYSYNAGNAIKNSHGTRISLPYLGVNKIRNDNKKHDKNME
jgi:hypothetical protein